MTTSTLPAGCSLRSLQPADLPALMPLHAAVMAALPDASMFRLSGGPEAFFNSHFGERGESLGVFLADELVAYGSLTFPLASDRDNYANDLGWPPERAARVALLSAAMVAPEHRRLGLHGTLIEARVARAQALGMPDLLVRAAPANHASRQTLIEHGFALVWLGVQAEGSLRHVFWRPVDRFATDADETGLIWADAKELEAHRAWLSAGRVGVRAREADHAIGFALPPG
jgi:GNAT superfamily N-acetyltransferase